MNAHTESVAADLVAEIAAELGAAVKTVNVHRSRVMAKLGVSSVAALVKLLARWGEAQPGPGAGPALLDVALAPGALSPTLGWLVVVDLDGLLTLVPPGGVAWLLGGGVAYTVGVVFYAIDRIPCNHAIWHLFVVAGSVCHYLAVLWYVIPMPMAG